MTEKVKTFLCTSKFTIAPLKIGFPSNVAGSVHPCIIYAYRAPKKGCIDGAAARKPPKK